MVKYKEDKFSDSSDNARSTPRRQVICKTEIPVHYLLTCASEHEAKTGMIGVDRYLTLLLLPPLLLLLLLPPPSSLLLPPWLSSSSSSSSSAAARATLLMLCCFSGLLL